MFTIPEHRQKQFNNEKRIWSDHFWKRQENKNLMNIIDRLGVAPCTLKTLDDLGLNSLEIINFCGLVGKKIHGLPSADIDFLNELEERFGIIFGYEQKANNNYIKAKVDHFCSCFNAAGNPMRVTALLTLEKVYY